MLTQDRLKQVISYNKKSGVFRWKQNKGHMKVGERAGGLAPTGYVLIGIDGLASKAYIKASKELHGAFSIYHK